MKKIVITTLSILSAFAINAQNLYATKNGNVSFYSKTPVEDIHATSNTVSGLINTDGAVAFIINNTSFDFPNKLMQEHFNEKYMESDKYPLSTFKGKINEPVDFSKDGEHKVTVTGVLNIHGVEQNRTIPGVLKISNGELSVESNFKVKVADHKITIPKLVIAKIAEEIDVQVLAKLQPKK